MKKILIILLTTFSLQAHSQITKIHQDTISYSQDLRPNATEISGDVVYMSSFSVPVPTENLLGYWCEDYGIEADSTIILVNTSNEPVDTIDLPGLDWDITAGYIPLKTAALMDWVGTPLIDTGFWNYPIYPTTVFQNIDYDSTTYFMVADHVLNADSTESHPARITEIAIYSQATDANTYFNVPDIGTVKWVDKYYTGGGNNGNYATPYTSIESAYKALTAGTPILVKSGTYLEEFNGTTIRYLYLDKASSNISSIGNVSLTSVSTSYEVRFVAASTHTLNRIIIDGQSNTTYNCDGYTANMTVNLNNCVFKRATGYSINTTVNATTQEFNLNNCVSLNGKTGDINVVDYCTVNESFINDVTYVSGKFYWNHIGLSGTIALKTGVRLNYNHFITGGYQAINAISVTGNYYIQRNIFDFTFADNGSNIYTIQQPLTSSQAIPYIEYNTFSSSDTGTLTRVCSYVKLDYAKTPKINHNTFTSRAKSQFDHIVLTASDSVFGKCELNYNSFASNSLSSTIINIGGENLKTGKFDSTELIGNKITGHLYDYPSTEATTHAMLLNAGINFDVRYNLIEYTHIGMVVKAGGEQSYTTNGVGYNVFNNNNRSLWVRGVKDLNVYNNTFVKTTTYDPHTGGMIAIDENSAAAGDQFSERVAVNNSIIYSNNNTVKLYMDQHAADSSCTVNNSLIWNNAADLLTVTATGYTLTEANAEGIITNSIQQNPNFTSVTQLWPITPFTGFDLGVTYNLGLDISTTWPTSIVTKQQGATWQIGAYIQ